MHIRSQHFRNADASVCLKVVFKECDEHSGRSNDRIVEGMREVLAVFARDPDTEASCLSVAEVGTGADLEILLLTG